MNNCTPAMRVCIPPRETYTPILHLRRKLRTGDAQCVIDELIDHKRSSG